MNVAELKQAIDSSDKVKGYQKVQDFSISDLK